MFTVGSSYSPWLGVGGGRDGGGGGRGQGVISQRLGRAAGRDGLARHTEELRGAFRRPRSTGEPPRPRPYPAPGLLRVRVHIALSALLFILLSRLSTLHDGHALLQTYCILTLMA